MRLSTSVRRLPWIGAAAFLLASVGPAFLAPTPTFAVDDGDSRVTSSATTTRNEGSSSAAQHESIVVLPDPGGPANTID